jgi:hypothetical protein
MAGLFQAFDEIALRFKIVFYDKNAHAYLSFTCVGRPLHPKDCTGSGGGRRAAAGAKQNRRRLDPAAVQLQPLATFRAT